VSQQEDLKISLETILGLTAFAAGAVDVIGFAKLGGILCSAMTGNLAFSGYYLSKGAFASAIGSGVALVGFVIGSSVGTWLARGRMQHPALRMLLGCEGVMLAIAAALWFSLAHGNGSIGAYAIITMFSLSMGMQGIVGKRVNLSSIPTVVFTSTLTNIVIALTDMVASGKFSVPRDTKRQCVSFLLYFVGALGAGLAVHFKAPLMIMIPFGAVAAAFVSALAGR